MTINFSEKHKAVYRVNTTSDNLMLRTKPGGDVIVEMPKGSKVICFGAYSGGWLGVYYSKGEQIYTGYCSKNYLREVYRL